MSQTVLFSAARCLDERRVSLNPLYFDRLMAAKRCKASISGKGTRYKKIHTVNLHSPATSVTGDCTLKVVEAVDRGVIGDASMRQDCRNISARNRARVLAGIPSCMHLIWTLR